MDPEVNNVMFKLLSSYIKDCKVKIKPKLWNLGINFKIKLMLNSKILLNIHLLVEICF